MNENNCLIIAGEKSGEDHALSFLSDIQEKLPEVKFWGVGGDELERNNVELLYHLKDFSSWGFSEVIGRIPFYFKALKKVEDEVCRRGCKTAILIDFQGFNLRLAKRLNQKGVEILYYVAPQAWVWKAKRTKILESFVHTLFTILPFEKNWFKNRGVQRVRGVEHPLLRTYEKDISSGVDKRSFQELQKKVRLLLLPGSRKFEVNLLLPLFIETIKKLKEERELEVAIVKGPGLSDSYFAPYERYFDKCFSDQELGDALKWSDLSLAASGTVTLTCALFNVPTVVCYKSSLLNEFIFYEILSYKGAVSLANIVHQKSIYPELIQNYASSYNMKMGLKKWLDNEEHYQETIEELKETRELLSGDDQNVGAYMADVIRDSIVEEKV